MFGRKHLQLAASIFGIIGSAIAIKSDSMKVLMVSSAIYGIGYAGHQLALTSIVEILPRKYRAITIGLFMGARVPADGFSPLIGAAITLHSSWRVIYWLALGLYLFSFIGTFLLYHPEKLATQKDESFGKRLIQFDYIGMFLTVAGIMTVAIGLIFGGTVFPW
jgi:predicted MFS family arabinose efflux permease